MASPTNEPTSQADVAGWIKAQMSAHDRYANVYDASERHRLEHGDCDVYPSSSGPLLGVLVAATGAVRVLEVGCGLGCSALWLADGVGPHGAVDTCEAEPSHADLARDHIAGYEVGERITIHVDRALNVLASSHDAYDFIFLDGDPDEYVADLEHVPRLLKVGGLLVTSNLFLGVYVPDAPWLADVAEYRRRLLVEPWLRTAFLPDGKALSVRVA